jgi:hypothetical protein
VIIVKKIFPKYRKSNKNKRNWKLKQLQKEEGGDVEEEEDDEETKKDSKKGGPKKIKK